MTVTVVHTADPVAMDLAARVHALVPGSQASLADVIPFASVAVLDGDRQVASVGWPRDTEKSEAWLQVTAERLAHALRPDVRSSLGSQDTLQRLHLDHRTEPKGLLKPGARSGRRPK